MNITSKNLLSFDTNQKRVQNKVNGYLGVELNQEYKLIPNENNEFIIVDEIELTCPWILSSFTISTADEAHKKMMVNMKNLIESS